MVDCLHHENMFVDSTNMAIVGFIWSAKYWFILVHVEVHVEVSWVIVGTPSYHPPSWDCLWNKHHPFWGGTIYGKLQTNTSLRACLLHRALLEMTFLGGSFVTRFRWEDQWEEGNESKAIVAYNVGPPLTIAKLVNITSITMVYNTYNYTIHGVYKSTYNWGSHIVGTPSKRTLANGWFFLW